MLQQKENKPNDSKTESTEETLIRLGRYDKLIRIEEPEGKLLLIITDKEGTSTHLISKLVLQEALKMYYATIDWVVSPSLPK